MRSNRASSYLYLYDHEVEIFNQHTERNIFLVICTARQHLKRLHNASRQNPTELISKWSLQGISLSNWVLCLSLFLLFDQHFYFTQNKSLHWFTFYLSRRFLEFETFEFGFLNLKCNCFNCFFSLYRAWQMGTAPGHIFVISAGRTKQVMFCRDAVFC